MPSQRPPRHITPRTFFEEWLPDTYRAAERKAPDGIEVRVRIEGEGGGEWDLTTRAGELRVSAAATSETPVTLAQSLADWRAVTVGEEGAIDLVPPRGGSLDSMFVDPALRQLLQTTRGTVRFEVTGYNGRTWALTLKLGDQRMPASPDATITVDAETYGKLLKRELQAPEAYFSGKIRIGGDTGLAMQIAMAMMPRFQ
jgi:putative sterol carrier protein